MEKIDLSVFVVLMITNTFAMLSLSVAVGLLCEDADPVGATTMSVMGCVSFLVGLAIDCFNKYPMFNEK